MTPEQWKRVNAIFDEALRQRPESRTEFLNQLSDLSVKNEVLSLLSAHEKAGNFLEGPVVPLHSDLEKGKIVGDFQILKQLGAGSFSTVYLAEQLSLKREVALKVGPNFGAEAQTMAQLEHDNIVKVYSEFIDSPKNLRFICMQYIAGTSLEKLLMAAREGSSLRFIDLIDSLIAGDIPLTLSALRERELMGAWDLAETFLWLGARLAHALDYAHQRGVLHLDVKPANILITPYGRPMLTDFNVSLNRRAFSAQTAVFGGTLDYMSPEQLEMFSRFPKDRESIRDVDQRADIYSLGVVLKEMMEKIKRSLLPQVRAIIDGCTEKDREKRFASASDVAKVLEGSLELSQILKSMPVPGRLAKWSMCFPFLAFFVFMFTPHILGSVVNISYNAMRIVAHLSSSQQKLFHDLVILYNLVVYPLCLLIAIRLMTPLRKIFQEPPDVFRRDPDQMAHLRKHVLALPEWVILIATLGWLPGSIFFPLLIRLLDGPVALSVFGHFLISFTLSWLIATTYCLLCVQFMVLRVYYPLLWTGCIEIRQTAGRELKGWTSRITIFHFLTVFTPLFAAMIIVLVGPDWLNPVSDGAFRSLLVFLLVLSAVGLAVSMKLAGQLSRIVLALTVE